MTSEVHFDDLLGGEGDDGAILLRPQELGRQVTQVEVRLTLLGAAGNLKISDENILVTFKKLHLSLLPTFLQLTCLSVTSVSADWLLDWSLAAKWARLPITYLAAAYPTQTNFFCTKNISVINFHKNSNFTWRENSSAFLLKNHIQVRFPEKTSTRLKTASKFKGFSEVRKKKKIDPGPVTWLGRIATNSATNIVSVQKCFH